jgi:hypothetical protein
MTDWTEQQLGDLVALYPKANWTTMKVVLGHSQYAIEHMARKIGVKRILKRYAWCSRHKFLSEEEIITIGKTLRCVYCTKRIRLI